MSDLRQIVDQEPMRGFQWVAIAVCVVLNMIDGFDVLVMAFTASSVTSEWSLSGAELGMLLSAGLLGMALGSLLLAPWADRIGRRPLILLCLVLSGTGMVLSSLSQSPMQLALLRGLTGLGIGGILASSNVIASEYANARWRGLAVSLQSTGYALGATLGGLLAVWLLSHWGWRSVFLTGGLITFAAIGLVLLWLPESLDFLLSKQPRNALQRVNDLAVRLQQPRLSALPVRPVQVAGSSNPVLRLFEPTLLRSTLLIWLLFFLVMFGFYFIMSWTPKLLTSSGLSVQQGVTGGVLLSVGGIFGATLLGLLSARFALPRVLAAFMLITAVMLLVFTTIGSSYLAALGMGLLIGLFSNGCVAGLYALSPLLYGASIRATGVGWAIGIGRGGAILSPTVAGLMLDGGWQPLELYGWFALVFVAAALLLLVLLPVRRITNLTPAQA
ncbi:Benzoate transport [Pseudomonas sp. 8Z]|uniref:MFS transporter n=1 Tax=Pseudomonas sp. 8Z TaxID=2653166 RepID=UPI0012EF5997|nr:MFS transporter [Pseudomonas sp. 8Z]VXC79663.1 Benzoate transport [Pseudomonas sp. 8Z]